MSYCHRICCFRSCSIAFALSAAKADSSHLRFSAGERSVGASTDLGVLWTRLRLLATPYFTSPESRGNAWLQLGGVLAFTLAGTGVSVWFNFLGRDFFNALSERNEAAFWHQLWTYLGGFLVGIPVFVLKDYIQGKMALDWRQWMTRQLLDEYLDRVSQLPCACLDKTGPVPSPLAVALGHPCYPPATHPWPSSSLLSTARLLPHPMGPPGRQPRPASDQRRRRLHRHGALPGPRRPRQPHRPRLLLRHPVPDLPAPVPGPLRLRRRRHGPVPPVRAAPGAPQLPAGEGGGGSALFPRASAGEQREVGGADGTRQRTCHGQCLSTRSSAHALHCTAPVRMHPSMTSLESVSIHTFTRLPSSPSQCGFLRWGGARVRDPQGPPAPCRGQPHGPAGGAEEPQLLHQLLQVHHHPPAHRRGEWSAAPVSTHPFNLNPALPTMPLLCHPTLKASFMLSSHPSPRHSSACPGGAPVLPWGD